MEQTLKGLCHFTNYQFLQLLRMTKTSSLLRSLQKTSLTTILTSTYRQQTKSHDLGAQFLGVLHWEKIFVFLAKRPCSLIKQFTLESGAEKTWLHAVSTWLLNLPLNWCLKTRSLSSFTWKQMKQRSSDSLSLKMRKSTIFLSRQEPGIPLANFSSLLKRGMRCQEQTDFLTLSLHGTMGTLPDFRGTAIVSAQIVTILHF